MRFLSIPRRGRLQLSGDMGGWMRALKRMTTRHKGRKALAKLDDHMLRDIGLTRATAEIEVEKQFWRG